MSELVPSTNSTPFHQIRKTRLDGTEFWSARELMPLLGYDRWENFMAAIDRANLAAGVQGYEVDTLFRGATKKTGGHPQQDYELARFACYQLAFQTRVEDQFVSTAKMIGVGKALDRISRYGQEQSSGRVGASFPRNGGMPRGARQADSASVVLGCFCHVGGEDYRRVCSHCGENKEPVQYVNIDKMPTPVYGGGNNQIKSPRVAATTGSMDTQNGAVHHG